MEDFISAEERVGADNASPWWVTLVYFLMLTGLIYCCLWTIGGY